MEQAPKVEGTSSGTSVLDDELEGMPPECWYINFGRYGQITLRQDEAQRAAVDGAKVWKYATGTRVPANAQ